MLVLSRKCGESLVIDGPDGPVTVHVQRVGRGKVSLGIEAPRSIPVMRAEVAADLERRATGLCSATGEWGE